MRHKTDAWNCANAGFVCTVLLMILSVYADFVWVIVIPEIALVESGYLRSIQVQRRSAAPDAAYAPARQLQLDARLRADAASGEDKDFSAINVEVDDDGDDEDEVELRRRPVSAVKILELEERVEIPGGGSGAKSDDEETRTRTRSRIGREKSAGQNSDTGVPWSSTTTPERWSGDEEVGPTAARPAAPERVVPVPSSTSAAVPVRRAETETSLYSSRKDNGSGEQDGAEDTIFSTRNPTTALPGDEKVISSSSTSDRAATSPASVAESAFASLHKQTARTGTESARARPEEGQGVVEAGDRGVLPVASRADSEAGGRDSGATAGSSTSSFDAGAALDGASDASSTGGVRWSIRVEPAASPSAAAAAGAGGAQLGDAAIRPIGRPDATRQEPQHSRLDEELLPPAEEEPLEELREDSPPWTRRSLASEGGDFFWGLITEKQYDEFYYFYVKDAGIAVLLVFHFFFALLLMAFYHAIVIDPGQVPANWGFYMGDESKRRRYCKMCNVWKPDRTHHCSICRRCVLNMDHHCPWINNCVGFYNRKFFMLFVVYAWLCLMMVCVFGFVIVLDKVWRYLSVISPHNGPGFAVAGGLYNLVEARHVLMVLGQCGATLLGCTLTNFMKFHVRLISENYTTIENLERDEGQKSKYDVGVRRNWEQVFGSNVLTWWIPLPMPNSRPHGDGVRWRVHYTRLTDEDDELPEDDQPQHRKLLR